MIGGIILTPVLNVVSLKGLPTIDHKGKQKTRPVPMGLHWVANVFPGQKDVSFSPHLKVSCNFSLLLYLRN